MKTTTIHRLGRSVTLLVPFYRRIKEKEFITTKLLIVMAIIAIAKIKNVKNSKFEKWKNIKMD
jgi:hypothetical protein